MAIASVVNPSTSNTFAALNGQLPQVSATTGGQIMPQAQQFSPDDTHLLTTYFARQFINAHPELADQPLPQGLLDQFLAQATPQTVQEARQASQPAPDRSSIKDFGRSLTDPDLIKAAAIIGSAGVGGAALGAGELAGGGALAGEAGAAAEGGSALGGSSLLGSGITDEMLLTGQAAGAGGTAAGEVAGGFSGAITGGAAGAAAGAGGAAATGGATATTGATGGAGAALDRIIAGTGTAGDFLTLGIPATGAAAALLAGANASSASKAASQAQVQASQDAIAEQRRQFDITQANNAPFLKTGTAANARLSQLLGTDPAYTGADSGSLVKPFSTADLNADPVYNSGLQFGLDEGTKAINARAIAGGNYDSGATLKALTRFGNDYGSTKANDSFNRFQTTQGNTFNRLSGVSGTGQTAVNQVATAGQNATNNITGSIADAGNARAAGIVGGANAITGAANNLGTLANNFSSNQTLAALLGSRQNQIFANG